MNKPEGLYLLVIAAEETLEIRDAQDVPLITFYAGNGDPFEWIEKPVRAVCEAWGITKGNDDGQWGEDHSGNWMSAEEVISGYENHYYRDGFRA